MLIFTILVSHALPSKKCSETHIFILFFGHPNVGSGHMRQQDTSNMKTFRNGWLLAPSWQREFPRNRPLENNIFAHCDKDDSDKNLKKPILHCFVELDQVSTQPCPNYKLKKRCIQKMETKQNRQQKYARFWRFGGIDVWGDVLVFCSKQTMRHLVKCGPYV